MTKRALLIGSQTGGLQGVHRDTDVLAETLQGIGFDVRTIIEEDAKADGIVRSYEDLIDDSAIDDTAIVYYAGHGSRAVNSMRRDDPTLPRHLQYIVPYDIDDRSGGRFRGLLAEELSALQRRLTDVCPNVTTILDCCHSARMFRDPSLLPRANDQLGFPWDDLVTRWQEVRHAAGADLGDVNPLAVQVVACEPHQSAYELAESALGGPHGALTAELIAILRRPDAMRLTWREVIEIVRPAILDAVPSQRPDVLGPRGDRLLFSLDTRSTTGVLGVDRHDGAIWLAAAALFGVAEGDTYALVEPGGDPLRPLAEGVVELVVGDRARLLITTGGDPEMPPGTLAHPLDVSLGRRPVVVRPADHPERSVVVDGLRRSPHVRVVDGDRTGGGLAAIELGDDGMRLLDAQDQPLWAAPRPVNVGNVGLLERSLNTLARATHLRELESGTGPAALPDAGQVEISFARLDPASGGEIPIEPGVHLHVEDAVVVRARNGSTARRYLAVLDIGLVGAIVIMTNSEASGVSIDGGADYVVGEDAAHNVAGVPLYWPAGLPDDAPRPESFIVLVADGPIEALPSLAQEGVAVRSAAGARGGSGIERLLGDVVIGTRDARPPTPAAAETRYRVERFDFVLHPTPRPAASPAAEPSFEIDTRPDPSFRLIVPRSGGTPPEHVSVRLSELTVHSTRAMLKTKVRVDFLAVTAAGGPAVDPFMATTRFFDRVRDGDRLPFDNMLIYDGPVSRFLDLAVWVSRADDREVSLTELMRAELDDGEVAAAVTTLASLAVAAPAAAAIAGSAAAVATLMHIGAKLLSAIAGTSIGVYRTSLLPHERFGAGDPALRHPIDGVLRAQDMSLAYEVVSAAPGAG